MPAPRTPATPLDLDLARPFPRGAEVSRVASRLLVSLGQRVRVYARAIIKPCQARTNDWNNNFK